MKALHELGRCHRVGSKGLCGVEGYELVIKTADGLVCIPGLHTQGRDAVAVEDREHLDRLEVTLHHYPVFLHVVLKDIRLASESSLELKAAGEIDTVRFLVQQRVYALQEESRLLDLLTLQLLVHYGVDVKLTDDKNVCKANF